MPNKLLRQRRRAEEEEDSAERRTLVRARRRISNLKTVSQENKLRLTKGYWSEGSARVNQWPCRRREATWFELPKEINAYLSEQHHHRQGPLTRVLFNLLQANVYDWRELPGKHSWKSLDRRGRSSLCHHRISEYIRGDPRNWKCGVLRHRAFDRERARGFRCLTTGDSGWLHSI